jgi:hypothetical protein
MDRQIAFVVLPATASASKFEVASIKPSQPGARPGGTLIATVFESLGHLGLKLERQRGRVEFLRIDRPERPDGN